MTRDDESVPGISSRRLGDKMEGKRFFILDPGIVPGVFQVQWGRGMDAMVRS